MTSGTSSNGENRQILQRLEFLVNTLNHICIGFIAIYLSWFCMSWDLGKTTPLHAWLVTIGFCLMMSEAIMCHYDGNVLTYSYTRKTKTTIHWVLQSIGGGCGIVGCLVIMISRGFVFDTTHGKLGFAAFIFCIISMTSGISAIFSQGLTTILQPLYNKTFHNLLGITTFVLAMAAQYHGYNSWFFSRKVSEDFEILMKVITIMALILTCVGPFKALYQKCVNIRQCY